MTTWTGNNRDRVVRATQNFRGSVAQSYTIAAVAGNTGGTLTCSNLSTIDNFKLRGYRVTGPTALANLVGRISGNTIVVTHDNPGENASVYVKVWGKR